jgi:Amt family ammonium transporter
MAWMFGGMADQGQASMLGAASGAVAGLVAITPAAVGSAIGGALVIGALAGVVCLWGVTGLKKLLGADDALDVFGIHGIGGILGALLTGVFNTWSWAAPASSTTSTTPLSTQHRRPGLDPGPGRPHRRDLVRRGRLHLLQDHRLTIGLRVPEEQEREGLDTTSHGERAYNI